MTFCFTIIFYCIKPVLSIEKSGRDLKYAKIGDRIIRKNIPRKERIK